jgi:hypothetical protein
MSGVLLSKDAARRVRDAVRVVERGSVAQSSPIRGERNRVFVRIVTEVGEGEYTAEQVKRSGDIWVVFDRDLFTLNETPVFEINGVTGIEIGTVVEVQRFWDDLEVDSYWGFGATGAGVATPFQGSIHADGDKITIGADRGISPTADPDYPFRDTITIGLDTLHKEFAEDSPVVTADKTFVYYKITKAGTAITAVLEASDTYPTQTHGEWYVVLGMANWEAADAGPPAMPARITKWTQYWFGDIHAMAGFA